LLINNKLSQEPGKSRIGWVYVLLSQDPSRKVGVLFLLKFSDPFLVIVPDEEDDDAHADFVPFVPLCSTSQEQGFLACTSRSRGITPLCSFVPYIYKDLRGAKHTFTMYTG
jgi:hypothetical protein